MTTDNSTPPVTRKRPRSAVPRPAASIAPKEAAVAALTRAEEEVNRPDLDRRVLAALLATAQEKVGEELEVLQRPRRAKRATAGLLLLAALLAPAVVAAQTDGAPLPLDRMTYPNSLRFTRHGELVINAGWPGRDIAGIAVNGWAGSGDNVYAQVLQHAGPGRVNFRGDMGSSDPLNINLYLTHFGERFEGDLFKIDAEDLRNYWGPAYHGIFAGNYLNFSKRKVEKFRVDNEGNIWVRGELICCATPKRR